MAGIHGRNARLFIATSENTVASGTLTHDAEKVFQAESDDRDWIFEANSANFKVEYVESTGTAWKTLDSNNSRINYAGGAVAIPELNDVGSLVVARNFRRSTLTEVGELVGQNRSIELTTNQDTVDATVMGESWGAQLAGIPVFSGTIEGLYLDSTKYKKAIQSASGVLIQRILRVQPVQGTINTYWQGTVEFSNWSVSMPFDGPIEETLEFSGQGPLDMIESGSAIFSPFM